MLFVLLWLAANCGALARQSSPLLSNTDLYVISIADVIGHSSINTQLLADTIVVPDIFHGEVIELNNFADVDLARWKTGGYNDRNITHEPVNVDPVVELCVAKMRGAMGLKKVGAVGYCFGGKYVVRPLNGKGGDAGRPDAGYIAYPSSVEEYELQAVQGPLAVAASEVDAIFTSELRHRSEEILAATGATWQMFLYGGVSHVFAVRGDLHDVKLRFAMEAAFEQAVNWFAQWLGTAKAVV